MSKGIADLVSFATSTAATEHYPTPPEKCVQGAPEQHATTHFAVDDRFFAGEWGAEVGRWRTEENRRPINPVSDYTTDDGERIRAHLAGTTGMDGRLYGFPHEMLALLMGSQTCRGSVNSAHVRSHGPALHDLLHYPHALHQALHVIRFGNVVRLDARRIGRIGRIQGHSAA